jgi:hypothetical protein
VIGKSLFVPNVLIRRHKEKNNVLIRRRKEKNNVLIRRHKAKNNVLIRRHKAKKEQKYNGTNNDLPITT